ncbi:hypothetical protein Phum_PHUM260570 [Pediculus humanus corporis]|uniref:Uncharacterized protein n=1 Tax=Pediculus humanus subsp. corporis TaxID=121224 RepID=E0VKD5_PEDHC|nr:uncharacterized protein Phum_PHUM260570 [Pediculus humanus corporis]EEB13841.1 hypothetical protein Phum_PHUM260570 [Pediculus humanus corporis]
MYSFEVTEIGRESVKSVNASMLATLIKDLDKLEFSRKKNKKNGDDEGFESDGNEDDSLSGDLSNEDAQSTTSSCCMVEDHVFKSLKSEFISRNLFNNNNNKDPTSLVSIIGSIDSANSSGSSDTDEIEFHSLTPSPVVTQTKKSLQKKFDTIFKSPGDFDKKSTKMEEYPISDVIFCHTEPKYPNVIAWVIKKNTTSDPGFKSGVGDNFTKIDNCLEVIVVKCKNGDNLKELCSNYLEYSKRTKLDNYKSIKRKSDAEGKKLINLNPLPPESKDVKVSLSDMKIENSGLIKASELSILNPKIMTSFKNDIKNSISLNSLIKSDKNLSNKTTIEIKPSSNNNSNVTTASLQSSVTKTQSLVNISKSWEYETSNSIMKTAGILKEKNYNVGDQFNLVQRTDPNGVTHLEVTKTVEQTKQVPEKKFANKSKLRKEIEGVIITDVESYCKKEQIRQRYGEKDKKIYDFPPPIRPERKKLGRKKNQAPSPPTNHHHHHHNLDQKITTGNVKNNFYLSPTTTTTTSPQPPQPQNVVVVVGDNRIKKEPNLGKSPLIDVKTWQNQNSIRDANNKTGSRGRQQTTTTKHDEKYVDKKRSTSAAGRPTKKTLMPYRYIYISNDYRESAESIKRCGLQSKIREVGGNLHNSLQNFRRRNSFDDIMSYNNNNNNNNCNKISNLKSVIKKNKKYCEPKKVTFSAFATVQVVD